MLQFNRLIKTSDKIRLEVISALLLQVVQGIQILFSLTGLGLLAFGFYQFFQTTPFTWLPVIIGALLVFSSNVIRIIHSLLKRMSIDYTFDTSTQTLSIEYAQIDYDFLPHTIPFSQIESLRLLNLKSRKSKAGWQLELILEDGKFFPLTAFQSHQKARQIIQELQKILHCSFQESTALNNTFSEYKQLFLQQFKS